VSYFGGVVERSSLAVSAVDFLNGKKPIVPGGWCDVYYRCVRRVEMRAERGPLEKWVVGVKIKER
jgi:hypothetical protein